MSGRFRTWAASSRLARVVALPTRTLAVARYDLVVLRQSARWLLRSREHTNFTYDLTERNLEHLAWFVAEITDRPVAVIRSYMAELAEDVALVEHIRERTMRSDRAGLADRDVRFGRRLGWYAIVRALRPAHVVETGTDKGLGSLVLASALLRNGSGRLTTIDINAYAGYLIAPPYAAVINRIVGDSVAALHSLPEVDLFIHDSDHSPEHERAELAALHVADGGIVLSDNAHMTGALASWAEASGRHFLFFSERPADHWWPGDGIGASWTPNPSPTA